MIGFPHYRDYLVVKGRTAKIYESICIEADAFFVWMILKSGEMTEGHYL